MHMPTAAMIAFAMPTLVGVIAHVTDRPTPPVAKAGEPSTAPATAEPATALSRATPTSGSRAVRVAGHTEPAAHPLLKSLPNAPLQPAMSLRGPNTNTLLAGDTYTCEALAQDATSAFFIDDADASVFQFDGAVEIGGSSALDPGVTFIVYEGRTELESTTLIQIEMGAYDVSGQPMPWVDASAAGVGLESWRMDIGTADINDPDPISLEGPFTVIASGMAVFGTDGSTLGEADLLRDDSTNTGLAGVATVSLGGEDIAGFELAAMQMWWEIRFDDTNTDPTGCIADLNQDGVVDIADIQAFVNSFLAGCN